MSLAQISSMSVSGPGGQVYGSSHLLLHIILEKPCIHKWAHTQTHRCLDSDVNRCTHRPFCLLNVGPFARCWTPPGLLASSAILYPRTVRYYKSQQGPQLIGRGRRSSDATVNYITEYETAHHCFFSWDRDTVTGI
ncbi:hypothetical protein AMECASPLE_016290 [Ameca splendens]|uniref:Uncharacterized protein n=1 Tax=Ameca splendens TaxID=208324 RepID=A0ABV0ZZC8_9TELE